MALPAWSPYSRLRCVWSPRHGRVGHLVSGYRFPRDIILLAVRYYLQLGAAGERIAGILADRGIDVSSTNVSAPAILCLLGSHANPCRPARIVEHGP
jgi:hypothetical protein